MQTSHNLMLSDDVTYRWKVEDGHFANNRELILKPGYIIPDPYVRINRITDNDLEYAFNWRVVDGKKKLEAYFSIPVEIKKDSGAIKTLVNSGVMKELNETYLDHIINFHNELASTFSYWHHDEPKSPGFNLIFRGGIGKIHGIPFPYIGRIKKHKDCFVGAATNPFEKSENNRVIFERIPPIENKNELKINKPKNKAIIFSNNGLKRASTIESEIKEVESDIREVESDIRKTILNCC
jgi:hypothetical protein